MLIASILFLKEGLNLLVHILWILKTLRKVDLDNEVKASGFVKKGLGE